MIYEHKFKDNDGTVYHINIFGAGYLDLGVSVYREDANGDISRVFWNPCYYDSQYIGFTAFDEDDKPLDESIEWTDEEWKSFWDERAWDELDAMGVFQTSSSEPDYIDLL